MPQEPTYSIDSLKSGIHIPSEESMEALGAWFAGQVPTDSVLTLSGDLGTGKTTFTRGFARELGVAQTVSSPTFNLYNIYQGSDVQLVHMDAYRLDSAADLDALMIEDFLVSPWIWVVEWPEKIADALPEKITQLELSLNSGRHRVTLLPNL